MTRKENKLPNFEDSLKELSKIVELLEGGGLPLEEALTQFEKGIHLTRTCQQALKEAEQKVQILIKQNDKSNLQPYDGDNLE